MTARQDVLAAAESLTAKGQTPFSPAALIGEARALGSSYPDATLRTFVVSHLAGDGWQIMRVAGTASKEQGVDIEATKDGRRMLAEVKGYPSTTYARGEKAGQPKQYGTATQARTYFSQALLTGMLLRAEHPDALVVLAFPTFDTYRNLAARLNAQLGAVGVSCWLVDEAGQLTMG